MTETTEQKLQRLNAFFAEHEIPIDEGLMGLANELAARLKKAEEALSHMPDLHDGRVDEVQLLEHIRDWGATHQRQAIRACDLKKPWEG